MVKSATKTAISRAFARGEAKQTELFVDSRLFSLCFSLQGSEDICNFAIFLAHIRTYNVMR